MSMPKLTNLVCFQQPYLMACRAMMTLRVLRVREA